MAAGKRHPVGAAVDLGSNSVHLLVAQLDGDRLLYLRDQSVLLNLGDVVDREKQLPEGTRQQILGALLVLRRIAQAEGAEKVTIIGTEPLRRAQNADEMRDEIRRAFGLPLHILSETAEAQLTYLGVGDSDVPGQSRLIVDIGGGSTEAILDRPGQPPAIHSLPSGSARLSNGIVRNDPPTPNEIDRLRLGARSLVAQLPGGQPSGAVFVGGTATNLVRLVPLTSAGVEAAHGLFTSLSVEELAARYGINRIRARQMPAGAAIVEALFVHYGLERAEVSHASLRDGAIRAEARLGDRWLERLDEQFA